VVVPFHNEARHIDRLIGTLRLQRVPTHVVFIGEAFAEFVRLVERDEAAGELVRQVEALMWRFYGASD
jgi:hypothetical protein